MNYWCVFHFDIKESFLLDAFYTAPSKLSIVKQTIGDSRLYNRLIAIKTLTITMHRCIVTPLQGTSRVTGVLLHTVLQKKGEEGTAWH